LTTRCAGHIRPGKGFVDVGDVRSERDLAPTNPTCSPEPCRAAERG
jgi:hypothetical protein